LFISRGTTKSRTIPGPAVRLRNRFTFSPTNITQGPWYSSPTGGTQVTESDGNRWPPPKGGDLADYGSEFFTRKTEILPKKLNHSVLYFKKRPDNVLAADVMVEGEFMVANAFGTSGPIWAGDTSGKKRLIPSFPDLSSTRSQLEVKGAIAVAACNPGNQLAAAASSIGELLQDVPHLPGIALWENRLKAIGTVAAGADEFLNVVFGVAPTIDDVMTFYKGVHKVDKRIDQFIRDSGRSVRRHFHFPKEVTTTTEVLANDYSPVGNNSTDVANWPLAARCLPSYETVRTRVVEREIWFSGAFTYHAPDWFETGSKADRVKLTAKLLGAQPDLNTLWQLTPWSWAIDWFTNANSYVKNLQSLISYGTVLRYGYVMETCTVTDTYSAGNAIPPMSQYASAFTPPYPAVQPIILRTTTKKRVQANPFGFGISWDGLSTVQRAIVAALGITRVVR
jgi:hypothetical protein